MKKEISEIDKQASQINSAEMTAYWRSLEPLLSGDGLSIDLASQEGINNARTFENKFNYSLVARLIGIRAGYFLRQAINPLNTGKYDSCISFASGFSLLNHYLANYFNTNNIQFYDTDLAHVVDLRQQRLETINHKLDQKTFNKVQLSQFDLEDLGDKTASLKQAFPKASRPLVLLEGIAYFITSAALEGLLQELLPYPEAAIIVDYFPEDAAQNSRLFANNFDKVGEFVPKIVAALARNTDIKHNIEQFKIADHRSIQSIESELCEINNLSPKLLNQDKFFPTQLIVLQK